MARKLKTSATPNIAILDWSSRMVRQLTREQTGDHLWQPIVWTRDGRHLFANRVNVAYTDSSVSRIEVATGKLEELTPHKGEILYTVTSLSPYGNLALLGSNEQRAFGNDVLPD